MNQWAFVVAAYALVGMATLALIIWSSAAMRRAERAVDALKDRQ